LSGLDPIGLGICGTGWLRTGGGDLCSLCCDGGVFFVRQVVIDAGAMPSIDLTAVEKLRPFLQKLIDQGIEVAVARAPLPLRELKLASELDDLFPEEISFPQVSDAVAAYMARKSREGGEE
jgi:hypothetical protein